MSFTQSIHTCFSKYITVSGRAQRAEYWWFALFIIIGSMICSTIDSAIFGRATVVILGFDFSYNAGFLSKIFGLLTALPSLAVLVRRLHDIGKSGWWIFISLIPLIGAIILLIWMIQKGDIGENAFGPDPIS